eukprot:Awhi_evm1s7634
MSLTKLFLVIHMSTIGAFGSAIPKSSSRNFQQFGKGPYIVEGEEMGKSIMGLSVGDRQACQKACENDHSCVGYFTYINPEGYFHSDSPPLGNQICRLMVDSSTYTFVYAEDWSEYLPKTKVDVYYDKNFKCPKGQFLGYVSVAEMQETYDSFGCENVLEIGDGCNEIWGSVSTLNGNLDKGCMTGTKCGETCEYPEEGKSKDDNVGGGILANGKKYTFYGSTMVIAGHNDRTFDVSGESTLNARWTKCAEHCGKTKRCKAFEIVEDKKKCYLSFAIPGDVNVELKDDPDGYIGLMDDIS